MSHWPEDYFPLNGCAVCGRDFAGVTYFDAHRVGDHEYDWSIDQPEGRRCMSDEELAEIGLRPITHDELAASMYHARAGFGVQLIFDPEAPERLREAFAGDEEMAA
jgi:hypothetical protein